MGTRCRRCGVLKPHFATGWSADHTFEYKDSGLCVSCRQPRRPSQGNITGLEKLDPVRRELARLNAPRKKRKEVS